MIGLLLFTCGAALSVWLGLQLKSRGEYMSSQWRRGHLQGEQDHFVGPCWNWAVMKRRHHG